VVVEERLWVFYCELLHQSGAMSIQPPPLLCQSWTGVISSGFSPLSFPVLLHTAFKQILLEDSNLEQCNIVQRVHTLQRLTNENAKLGSILSLSGNIPTIFLIHLGHSCYILSTFDVHSTYFNCIFFQFLDARSVFGSHAPWLHSYSIEAHSN